MEFGQTGTNNRYLNNLLWGHMRKPFQFLNGNTDSRTIYADPQLVNFQPEGSGDYHLAAGSPAIDAGTSEGAPTEDFDAIARPQAAGWDIGPYEWRP